MKRMRGFTLVELMAVIAILAIILTLVVPKVFKSIEESKKRACNVQMEYIIDAASTYFTKYRYNTADNGMTYDESSKSSDGVDITLAMLSSASLLKGQITNPVTDNELQPENTKVNIKNVDEVFTYTLYEYDTTTRLWRILVCE